MSVKDKYGNNIRRGNRIKDLSDEERGEGTVVGTYLDSAVIQWDSGAEEEQVKSDMLVVTEKRFR